MVLWLRLGVSKAGGAGLIPCLGATIPYAMRPKKPKHKIETIL